MKYDQLRIDGACLFLGNEWSVLELKGVDTLSFLHAQVTNDLMDLAENQARLCARLDRNARLQSFFYFLRPSENNKGFLLIPSVLKDAVMSDLNKFIIMEDVEVHPKKTDVYFTFGLAAIDKAGYQAQFYGLPGVFHFSKDDSLDVLDLEDARGFRVLSGFPAWGVSCHSEMLVNETSLNELAVNYKKGCFLGQETAAKVQNNRGAAFYPTLLKFSSQVDLQQEELLYVEGKKIAKVLETFGDGDRFFALVSLRREERIDGSSLECTTKNEQKLKATVSYIPYYKATSFKQIAQELYELGGNYFRDGDEDLAKNYLEKAIKFDPAHEDAYESLGVILGRQEKYLEAIEMMNQLEKVNPKTVMANTNKSLFYMKLGNIEEAEKEKAEATLKSFQYFGDEAKRKKEEEQKERQKLEDRKSREAMFLQVIEIDDVDEIALYGLAEIRYEQNNRQQASEYLQKLLEHHPKHTKGHLLLGKIHLFSGHKEDAKKVLSEGLLVAKKKGEMMPANEIQGLLNQL